MSKKNEQRVFSNAERKCPFCGNTFIAAPFHVYKCYAPNASGEKQKLFCSYSCMMDFERKTGKVRYMKP